MRMPFLTKSKIWVHRSRDPLLGRFSSRQIWLLLQFLIPRSPRAPAAQRCSFPVEPSRQPCLSGPMARFNRYSPWFEGPHSGRIAWKWAGCMPQNHQISAEDRKPWTLSNRPLQGCRLARISITLTFLFDTCRDSIWRIELRFETKFRYVIAFRGP